MTAFLEAVSMLDKIQLRYLMTPIPYNVSVDAPLTQVKQELDKHNVRHLPVMDGSEVVGIVSDRDISFALALAKHAVEEEQLTAGAVCTSDPYVVDVEERFDRVLSYMGKSRIGSAVITENGQMVGIITTTDVCTVCGEIIKELFEKGE